MMSHPVGYHQLEAGAADMFETTAAQASILAAAAVTVASPPASGHTLFGLHSEKYLFSTHVDDDESAGYANCFPGCNSLEMCAIKCTCSCWSSSHSVGWAIPDCQL
jgi:hypothetical protein